MNKLTSVVAQINQPFSTSSILCPSLDKFKGISSLALGKALGLNISKVSENALKDMIRRIEGSNSSKIFENKLDKVNLVGPPGFEPESRESKSQSLDQASRRPLSV